jgi:plastocyanin domain-containing protein
MMRKLVFMVLVAFPLAACGGQDGTEEAPEAGTPSVEATEAEAPEGIQIVQVSVQGSQYIFSPTSVQAGMPVRLVFDPDGLPGCSRDVTVPAFEIEKTIVEDDTTIEFTPEAQGSIAVACTMDMYRGSLQVQ